MKTTIVSALSLALLMGASAPSSANMRSFILLPVNQAKQSGSAVIIDKMIGGVPSVRVTLQLTNAPNLPHEPAHIHFGYCSNGGTIFRPLNFPRLVPGTSDAGQGIADSITDLQGVTVDKLVGMHASINVHYSASPRGLPEVLSCGNIK